MRQPRLKVRGRGYTTHVCNRIAGKKSDLPFGPEEREFGFRLVQKLSKLYLIEVISCVWMSNHYHLIAYVPDGLPSLAVAAERHNAFYGAKRMSLDPERTPEECAQMAEQLVDLSSFVGMLQQRFTFYFNKKHDRRGRLWGDRFKNSLLEGELDLLACVKYVELNPVRAGIVDDPAAYRWCTWGRYKASGRHPFAKHFRHHLQRSLGQIARGWKAKDLYGFFAEELARTMGGGSGLRGEDLEAAKEEARERETRPLNLLVRSRFWLDGAIIGSKDFVREVACAWQPEMKERFSKKRLARGDLAGTVLTFFRQIREG